MPPNSNPKAPAKAKAKISPPSTSKSAAKPKAPSKAKTTSKAKAKSSTATAIPSENALAPLTEFTIFSRLPGEMQLMIWKNCHFSRIVTLKPSKSQFPSLLHACSDSRHECIKAGYQLWTGDTQAGFVISPWKDILLLDRTSFSSSLSYHVNSFHTMKCRRVEPKMLEPIKKLAFTVREVMKIWRTQCFHCFLMTKLSEFFPNIEELIIILRPGPLEATHDDLYQVHDCTAVYLKTAMTDIQKAFKNVQDEGACKGVELKMMRVENWST